MIKLMVKDRVVSIAIARAAAGNAFTAAMARQLRYVTKP
jgi:hypothetical protein